LRIAFLGSPPFATGVFSALVEGGVEVVGLVTAPPRGAGRGRKRVVNPLVETAQAAGIPVLQPESARDPGFKESFAGWQADAGVVASYGQILDEELLGLPRCGCLNLHASLLPRWRGASPIQAAILAGDRETGVCVQRMVPALDAGDVIAERVMPIGERESAPQLFDRLVLAGADLMLEVVRRAAATGGFPVGVAQDESAVTTCRRIRKSEGRLDWSLPATDIDRRVRAMAGWPCATTTLPDGTSLKVHAGEVVLGPEGGPAGTLLAVDDGLVVACGTGAFRIDDIQRQGKARLAAADFQRGAQLAVGEMLGND
jgi:methionyl-tRNA formyltransferase